MIKEFGKYITDNVSGLALGTNFFVGHFPPNQFGDASALIETGGQASYFLPDKRELRYQVMTRAENYQDARDKALAIHNFLHGKTAVNMPVVTSNVFYLVNIIESIQTPQYLGVDDRGLHLVSTNYVVKVQEP